MRSRFHNPVLLEVGGPLFAALVASLAIHVAITPLPGWDRGADPQRVRIYVSVPMNRLASIVHGVQMAIDDADA